MLLWSSNSYCLPLPIRLLGWISYADYVRPGRLTPFAQLDALYQHIFSQVDDLPTTLELLAYWIFGNSSSIYIVSHFFELEESEVESVLLPLASVVLCDMEKGYITFHHASLPEFPPLQSPFQSLLHQYLGHFLSYPVVQNSRVRLL